MQPGHDDLHVDAMLTNMSIAYVNEMYIANQVFPEVTVQRRSDIIPAYDKSSWFRNEARRLSATEAPPVGGYTVNKDMTYYCFEYGIGHLIPDETRANTDRPFDPDKDGMAWLVDKMLMAQERYFVDNFWKTTVWGVDVVGNSGFTYWDTYASSTPTINVRTWKRTMRHTIAREPNVLVLGDVAYDVLLDHPSILDRIKYGASEASPAMVTTNVLAQILGLQTILVGTSIYTASPEGTAEGSVVYSANFSDNALLLYRPSAPSLRTPAAGYTFVWSTAFGGPQYIRRRREPIGEKADLLEMFKFWDMKVTAAAAGTFISNATSL
jgi:hypothetical protein